MTDMTPQQSVAAAIKAGTESINDARRRLGLRQIAGADTPIKQAQEKAS